MEKSIIIFGKYIGGGNEIYEDAKNKKKCYTSKKGKI